MIPVYLGERDCHIVLRALELFEQEADKSGRNQIFDPNRWPSGHGSSPCAVEIRLAHERFLHHGKKLHEALRDEPITQRDVEELIHNARYPPEGDASTPEARKENRHV